MAPEDEPHPMGELAQALARTRTFARACEQVVKYLSEHAPMGLWAVSRVADHRQVMLAVDAPGYPIEAGAEFPFSTSLCHIMGQTTSTIPDIASAPEYAAALTAITAQGLQVRAYAGAPILTHDGELFGTICGFSPHTHAESLRELQPLLEMVAGLLSAVLEADTLATTAAREMERFRRHAGTDALTGLLNRRGWDHFLTVEEPRYQRFADPASVVVIDIDHLKEVNDTAGHQAGDQVLQLTADALRRVTRAGDVTARLGGDEFGIIAAGTDAAAAAALVQRLRSAFDDAGVPASIGSAPYTVAGGFTAAWKAADEAMYEQKRDRRHPPNGQ